MQNICVLRDYTYIGLVLFINGAAKRPYVRDVGAAPLQRHPAVAVVV
jgi:hypothetical protein